MEIRSSALVQQKHANAPAKRGTFGQADTSKVEAEIDQLVAPRQLYGLSPEEIAIVEGKE